MVSRTGITEVSSVSEFVTHVMDWTRNDERPVAFRGQSFHAWPTLPRIFRPEVGLYDYEKNAVRDLISIHPQEFDGDETMFDRLVRMQHFDLPTRLLDVTTNPLVALYFATDAFITDDEAQDGKVQALFLPENRQRYFDSDRVSCIANLSNLTVDEKKGSQKLTNCLVKSSTKARLSSAYYGSFASRSPISPQTLIRVISSFPFMLSRR